VKNILVFLLFFLCIGCSSSILDKKSIETADCPRVLYSSEHKEYIDSKDKLLNVDNLTFKATINNHGYSKSCSKTSDTYLIPLDILFVIKPLDMNNSEISLPVYAALLDSNKKLIDIQYFFINVEINMDSNSKEYIETEISRLINILTINDDSIYYLVLGFMIDNNRLEILN